MVNLAVSACVLRTTTTKGRQLVDEKCTPGNPGYAYALPSH